jgi:hypothetical protein
MQGWQSEVLKSATAPNPKSGMELVRGIRLARQDPSVNFSVVILGQSSRGVPVTVVIGPSATIGKR